MPNGPSHRALLRLYPYKYKRAKLPYTVSSAASLKALCGKAKP